MSDRLAEIEQRTGGVFNSALTTSDVQWLIQEVKRLRFERDCLAGYAEGLLGLGMSVDEYIVSRRSNPC